MAGRRKERMMREKGETWKSHQELSEDKKKKKKKKKINVPFFSSVWFHFPWMVLHHRGRQEKWDATKRRVEKGKKKKKKEREMTHIHKNREHLTSQNTPDDYLRNAMSTVICLYVKKKKKKSHICTFSNVSPLLPHLSLAEWMFLFYYIFKLNIFLNGNHTKTTPQIPQTCPGWQNICPGTISVKSRLGPKRAWQSVMWPSNNYTALGQDDGQCLLSWGKLQGGYAK